MAAVHGDRFLPDPGSGRWSGKSTVQARRPGRELTGEEHSTSFM